MERKVFIKYKNLYNSKLYYIRASKMLEIEKYLKVSKLIQHKNIFIFIIDWNLLVYFGIAYLLAFLKILLLFSENFKMKLNKVTSLWNCIYFIYQKVSYYIKTQYI
jgi:hypothetical protein